MKDFKQSIALALAVVMTASMAMTVGASSFTDADQVSHAEAVDVMEGINVINGYLDGSFRPEDPVTRGEMAKMVFTILNKGKDDASLYNAANQFTDCNSHWARGYIAFASNRGVVDGLGNGTFNPEGQVTGLEAMKMLLVALGYDSEIENYTGTNWKTNVIDDGETAGLNANFSDDMDFNQPMTREQAAQMMLNAMESTMVAYETKGGNVSVGDLNFNTGASTATSLTWAKNGGKEISYDITTDDTADGLVQLCEKYFPALTLDTATTDDFGRFASVWSFDDTTLHKAANQADVNYVVGSAMTLAEALKKINSGYTLADDATYYLNGAEATPGNLSVGTVLEITMAGKEATHVVAYTYQLAEITKVSTAAATADYDHLVSLAGLGSYKDTAIAGFDAKTMETGDQVIVVPGASKILHMAIPQVVKGNITAYTATTATMGGTRYTASGNIASGSISVTDFDNQYALYLDPNGYILSVELQDGTSDSALEYIYLSQSEIKGATNGLASGNDAYGLLKVTHLNGTEEVVDLYVAKADGTEGVANLEKGDWYYVDGAGAKQEIAPDSSSTTAFAPGFYTYEEDGDQMILTALDSDVAAGTNAADAAITVTTGNATLSYANFTGAASRANSKTVLTMVNGGTVKTYTGISNFPTATFTVGTDDVTAILVTNEENSSIAANIVVLGGEASATDTTVGYLAEIGDYTKDGHEMHFYVDGQAVVYYAANTTGYAQGNLYTIEVDEDDNLTAKTLVNTMGTVATTDPAFLTMADGTDLYFTDDTVVYNVSGDFAGAEGTVAQGDAIVYTLANTNELVTIYIVDAPEITGAKIGETAVLAKNFTQNGTDIHLSGDAVAEEAIVLLYGGQEYAAGKIGDEVNTATIGGYTFTVHTDSLSITE